ncbi:YoaK family protein [Actinopolymorpha cephalotaxi]|uniref:Uncharacterized membrane protein YoaK (UPF0700 family) n=1 Tax=Actinopolymorpha cephalotaxi TaxID=504797 RepID=A0ABX2S421_9ACTN|nr:YoaK family protein [Actinopolymorpha cephalotaxi]NYH84034.1 uncharacterized membrane protein YoaK (UPF0700 family) [Actinopolymorpha cephalotaxi]
MPDDSTQSQMRISIVLLALTVTSAAVDAVTFLALGHAFATLVTGNVLLLGFAVVRGGPVLGPALAVTAFVVGVAAAHAVIVRVSTRGRRWFIAALAAETAVICSAGIYAAAVSGSQGLPAHAKPVVIVLLACAMGWRNRAMVDVDIPEMPTTVAQTTLVKTISDLLPFHSGTARASALTRARRAATILGMFTGAAAGTLLLRLGPGPTLLVVAGIEAAVTAIYARTPRLRPPAVAEPP